MLTRRSHSSPWVATWHCVCDACPVWGGVTTEEAMFALPGAYYIAD